MWYKKTQEMAEMHSFGITLYRENRMDRVSCVCVLRSTFFSAFFSFCNVTQRTVSPLLTEQHKVQCEVLKCHNPVHQKVTTNQTLGGAAGKYHLLMDLNQ